MPLAGRWLGRPVRACWWRWRVGGAVLGSDRGAAGGGEAVPLLLSLGTPGFGCLVVYQPGV